MTGFGKAVNELENKKIVVEIRSLNSKQMDLSLRMPGAYKEKELELRSAISKEVERGRADVSVYIESATGEKNYAINKALAASYYNDLKLLAENIGVNGTDFMSIIMKMPDVLKNERPEPDKNEWEIIAATVNEAIKAFNIYRITEGEVLGKDISERVNIILALLKEIESVEAKRIPSVRERIQKNLHEFIEKDTIDRNRFEQELIYYLEKIDITEEKVRLRMHCNYFLETLKSNDSEGRKLGFITQEIGREINTIGSKANDADMQKMVVQMKDELEKMKEQLLNVL